MFQIRPLILLFLVACGNDPASIEVFASFVDLDADRMAASRLEDLSIDVAQQSTDKRASNYTDTLISNADGEVTARVTNNQIHTIAATAPTNRYGATAWFLAHEEPLNLLGNPIPVPERDFTSSETLDYCAQVLNVQTIEGTTGTGLSWLRVYKRTGEQFSNSDELTIFGHDNAADLRNGQNLISNAVTSSNPDFVDIYDDSTTTGDKEGHVDEPVLSQASDEPDSMYSISLNGTAMNVRTRPCSEGSLTVVYL